MSITSNLQSVLSSIPKDVTLVAVSKTKPTATVLEAYEAGQRIFGENKVQEMVQKAELLPKDIAWHMIGHLQSNKVKYIAPFVSLIHGVDSEKLFKEINKRAAQNNRVIDCLLQFHIAEESSKFGLNEEEAKKILEIQSSCSNVRIVGLMGMATFTSNKEQIKKEFSSLNTIYKRLQKDYRQLKTLSMGMSGDYPIAIDEGSNMIRVGSAIFGARQ
ncbi:MAG: YggS family pyridoxal phosphate-dependent enzyme [Flavobacteriales bacterium]|nr:YggS family pyridoxal phosphate-dependent enzyme [Flavobacteriales bacterium]|tara:strand:- start:980 stop:1627 length:648 start_codon:yes stop_codon:yes gene_type:complete